MGDRRGAGPHAVHGQADTGRIERIVASGALTAGSSAALVGLGMIWLARASVHRPVYVSELGATGMHTAAAFTGALLLVAFGGATIALLGRHPRGRTPLLRSWPIGATIGVSSIFFAVASQVRCTATCPAPVVNPASTPQDLVHTLAAVLGFAAGCVAMLQLAAVARRSVMARASLLACAAVAGITITGGMLSLLHTDTSLGGVLEFAGTSVAVVWLAGYGLWLAFRPQDGYAPPRASSAIS